MENLIIQKSGKEVKNYISRFADVASRHTSVFLTRDLREVKGDCHKPNVIINMCRVNHIRFINKFFEGVNSKLNNDDLFIGTFETIIARRQRLAIAKVPILGKLFFGIDFLFNRVAPKVTGLKKIYFFLTQGKNRLLSKAEVLGRLVCCGFEIIDYKEIDGLIYFVVKKVKEPRIDLHPSYGALVKMDRMGQDGKIIGVYKFRTMHPFSEYLHDHILKMNGYSESGKPAKDFRLTPWGRFMRKYWLDELPQLINVVKGELKLVGVRPVSRRYFEDIPLDVQLMRLKQKPGCIPPYVIFNRKASLVNAIESEREYLLEKSKKGSMTDTRCFFRAMYNIFVNKIRSA